MNKAIEPYQKLKSMVSSDEIQARFRAILDSKAPGFLASVLNTVYQNDALRSADPNTVIISALTAAALDLPVDPNLGFSYIIPYKGKAQFQMGYKGYIQLSLRSGQYEAINATPIYQGQEVHEDQLSGKIVLNGQRVSDEVIGYAGYFKLKNGFEKFIYMTVDEIHEHAKQFSKSYHRPDSAWKTHFDAMARKTMLRLLLSKYGIMSIQMQNAYEIDKEPSNGDQLTGAPDLDQEVLDATMSDPEPDLNPEQVVDTPPMAGETELVAWIVDNGHAENEHAAKNIIKGLKLTEVDIETAHKRVIGYRGWREMDAKPDKAYEYILGGDYPVT